MKYFVSSPEEAKQLQIDPQKLIDDLFNTYSNMEAREINNLESSNSYTWITGTDDQRLYGSLQRDRGAIVLEGDFMDCAEFAIWFRSRVPADQKLLFYDDSFSSNIELTKETSLADIDVAFA